MSTIAGLPLMSSHFDSSDHLETEYAGDKEEGTN
jgi:hypothetical protein